MDKIKRISFPRGETDITYLAVQTKTVKEDRVLEEPANQMVGESPSKQIQGKQPSLLS